MIVKNASKYIYECTECSAWWSAHYFDLAKCVTEHSYPGACTGSKLPPKMSMSDLDGQLAKAFEILASKKLNKNGGKTGTLTPHESEDNMAKNSYKIEETKLGEAKKRRNLAREQLLNAVNKIAGDYGCTRFEAVHAICDTVISGVHQGAHYEGGYLMSNALAQTLLPSTVEMVEEVKEAPPAKPTYDLDEHIAKTSAPPWVPTTVADTAGIPAKTEHKIIDKMPETHKDKFVSEGLCTKNKIVWSAAKSYYSGEEVSKWIAANKEQYPSGILCRSHTIGVGGKVSSAYHISKYMPFVSEVDQAKHHIVAPYHYKWKKVYNKPFVKLVIDKKNPPYKIVTAVTKNYTGTGGTLTSMGQIISSANTNSKTYEIYEKAFIEEAVANVPPNGFHWETCGNDPTKAIYMKGDTCPPYYAFPPQWFKDELKKKIDLI